jgi:hypothetical protein
MFSWSQTDRGKSQRPVARITSVEETNLVKLIDKAIHGMVSESPGRNASEPTGSLDKKQTSEAEPFRVGRRLHDVPHSDQRDTSLRRGGRGSTVTRTCQATGEAVLTPSLNRRSKVGRITVEHGKSTEGETVAAGSVVAMNRSNSRGAKGPCCTRFRRQYERQG